MITRFRIDYKEEILRGETLSEGTHRWTEYLVEIRDEKEIQRCIKSSIIVKVLEVKQFKTTLI